MCTSVSRESLVRLVDNVIWRAALSVESSVFSPWISIQRVAAFASQEQALVDDCLAHRRRSSFDALCASRAQTLLPQPGTRSRQTKGEKNTEFGEHRRHFRRARGRKGLPVMLHCRWLLACDRRSNQK
ncbi:hypothetical protein MRX96_056416 [Rhipicephalus microplus]